MLWTPSDLAGSVTPVSPTLSANTCCHTSCLVATLPVSNLPPPVLGGHRNEVDPMPPVVRTFRRRTWCNPNLILDAENWCHLAQHALVSHGPYDTPCSFPLRVRRGSRSKLCSLQWPICAEVHCGCSESVWQRFRLLQCCLNSNVRCLQFRKS